MKVIRGAMGDNEEAIKRLEVEDTKVSDNHIWLRVKTLKSRLILLRNYYYFLGIK